MSDETTTKRTPRDPKAVAQDKLDVLDRKIERAKKHKETSAAALLLASNELTSLTRQREYAAQDPALQEPETQSGNTAPE